MLFLLPLNLPAKKISVGEPGASQFKSLAFRCVHALCLLVIVVSDNLHFAFALEAVKIAFRSTE